MQNRLSAKEKVAAALNDFIITLKAAEAIADEHWDADVMNVNMRFRGEGEKLFVPLFHHKVTLDEFKTWAATWNTT